ncbi:MAG TPA: hypothetical protein PLK99_05375 [Burkholderiales bacterium]|nr:hypothetical protein [Burkholderiales bacterium]
MKGYTVLESMIAFILIALGLVGAVKLQDAMVRKSVYARQLSEATLLCQQEMETLRAYASRSAFDALATDSAGNTVNGVNAAYVRTWTVSTNAFGTRAISVRAAWTGIDNQPESVTMSSEMSYSDPEQSALLDLLPSS